MKSSFGVVLLETETELRRSMIRVANGPSLGGDGRLNAPAERGCGGVRRLPGCCVKRDDNCHIGFHSD